jgi:ribosome-binding protein aMBF1 (putative translation factor)
MLDTTYHNRRRTRRLADPERRREYDLAVAEVEQMNNVVRDLDVLRVELGLSKAQLARDIERNDAVVRRFFTADVNPELRMVAQVAARLGARIAIIREDVEPMLETESAGIALSRR